MFPKLSYGTDLPPLIRICPPNDQLPSVPALRSTNSAADRSALFVGFTATMAGSDFSCPFIIGYGSSPFRCGPSLSRDADGQTRDLPASDAIPLHVSRPRQGDSTSHSGAAHVAFGRIEHSAPAISNLSWLNPTPHAIAVYPSQPLSPVTTQHSLPSGRYSLLGPDLHRLDRTSFAAGAPIPSLRHRWGAALAGGVLDRLHRDLGAFPPDDLQFFVFKLVGCDEELLQLLLNWL